MSISDIFAPLAVVIILITAIIKRVDIFTEFTKGAKEGLKSSADIIAPLILLITSVGTLRESGLLEYLAELSKPFLSEIGFPAQVLPLAIIRPFSGSGANAVYESILREVPINSYTERVASVLCASSETTFYTLAVYFSAVKRKKARHTLIASLSGDAAVFVLSAISVKIFFG